MDLVSKSHSIRASRALLSTITSPRAAASAPLLRTSTLHHANDNTSFPIIAIAIIGILATAFLLVGYYVFVIRCCLNWHRIDLLRRFSLSAANRAGEELLMAAYSPRQPQSRGLDESTIRSIPVFRFGKDGTNAGMFAAAATTNDVKFSECAVCLNEFEEGEKLRIIPNCLHIFHIDCIDVWLQSNANCPLCRTSISANRFQFDPAVVAPSPSPIDPDDEDYVVIELSNHDNNIVNNNNNEADQIAQRAAAAAEASPRKMENSKKKRRFFSKGSSMGDECIDTRGGEKDEEFAVAQPIRRSFSMDSSADRKMFLAIQEAVRHCREVSGSEVISSVGPIEGCSSSSPSDNNNNNINNRVKRSFFSFGQGRGGSRSAVLPVYLEP